MLTNVNNAQQYRRLRGYLPKSTRKPVDALYGRCITKMRTSLYRLGYRRSQKF
ncbi:MAG: hypothetical protein F6K40_35250 [Okeania sp. SIO3I5]|uniref:hypothetical protein n=1 Tax=Okeania sp. SIO3I5 TaxID=2607805 RepID=UPI0013BB0B1E|nr:hypothetical protein [Okeania sp. SIO3I5]NEQ41176.1 hypothetical protein [Okeania sp. SIO3I5]